MLCAEGRVASSPLARRSGTFSDCVRLLFTRLAGSPLKRCRAVRGSLAGVGWDWIGWGGLEFIVGFPLRSVGLAPKSLSFPRKAAKKLRTWECGAFGKGSYASYVAGQIVATSCRDCSFTIRDSASGHPFQSERKEATASRGIGSTDASPTAHTIPSFGSQCVNTRQIGPSTQVVRLPNKAGLKPNETHQGSDARHVRDRFGTIPLP